MPRSSSDTAQTLYLRHNKDAHHDCASCRSMRESSPRLAATLDGEVETARRAAQYRAGDFN